MIVKKIIYKGIAFDDFTIYCESSDIQPMDEMEEKPVSFASQVCPWCCKRYGFFKEIDSTPESIDWVIQMYAGEDPTTLNEFICGVEGCTNGISDDMWMSPEDVTLE